MEGKTFGYARVSTAHQKEDRQVEALLGYGVAERNIIIDRESGKSMDRQGYQTLKTSLLRDGDVLVVKELDRLSRRKEDIRSELEELKGMGVRVKILDIPTTLTDIPEGQEWVLEMVNSILIEVMGSIAEEERNKIRRRQREGIDMAKARGVPFGRPRVTRPGNWEEVMGRVEDGEITSVQAMAILGMKKTSYYKLRKAHKNVCGGQDAASMG